MLEMIFALSLTVDALGIAVSYGARKIRITLLAKLIVCSISFTVTSLSVYLGAKVCEILPENVTNIMSVVLLFLMGSWIIFQGFKVQQSEGFGDLNHSKVIEPIEGVYIGIAVSIDSIGAGVAIGALGLTGFTIPILVASFHFCFLTFGSYFGAKIKNGRILAFAPGFVFITMAILKLL